jgi:hypothetical protein
MLLLWKLLWDVALKWPGVAAWCLLLLLPLLRVAGRHSILLALLLCVMCPRLRALSGIVKLLNRLRYGMLQLRQLVFAMTAATACGELSSASAELRSKRSARNMQQMNEQTSLLLLGKKRCCTRSVLESQQAAPGCGHKTQLCTDVRGTDCSATT